MGGDKLRNCSFFGHRWFTYMSSIHFSCNNIERPFLWVQSGCCKPPTACGFTYSSPTVWINPANPAADTDCYLWGNDPAQLCYNCNACKAGLLGDLRSEWRKANVILIVVVVVLIWVYIIACCALRNVQTEELFSRYKEGWA
ncbi:hypothetical protein MLD38_006899 [Melastoma candidum]|uniref:Uncharacterized protein n=1 Tax=Melastoma candidum TaxID=119954 RepID=A0ACB9RR95_9MYRT|nr:hypothetical protein MLD38_006899 [Melastoma candidum]